MKQQEVFKKIGVIIQEINEQYEYLQGTAANLNDLELELFVANTHFLKDHAEILRKLNAIKSQPPAKTSIRDEPKWFEPVVQPAKPAPTPFKPEPAKPVNDEPVQFEIVRPAEVKQVEEPVTSIDLSSNVPADSYAFELEEPETITPELLLDEAVDDEDKSQDEMLLTPFTEIAPTETDVSNAGVVEDEAHEEITAAADKEPETEPEVNLEEPGVTIAEAPYHEDEKPVAESMEEIQIDNLKAIVVEEEPVKAELPGEEIKPAELFAADDEDKILTLNQRLSAQRKGQNAAGSIEVVEPLADIKTAINLNDKLLFVKDLFKGYNLAYTEAIEIVNRFSSFEEADRFLKNNYVTKNNWEDKKDTSDKFYALLKRRYA